MQACFLSNPFPPPDREAHSIGDPKKERKACNWLHMRDKRREIRSQDESAGERIRYYCQLMQTMTDIMYLIIFPLLLRPLLTITYPRSICCDTVFLYALINKNQLADAISWVKLAKHK